MYDYCQDGIEIFRRWSSPLLSEPQWGYPFEQEPNRKEGKYKSGKCWLA